MTRDEIAALLDQRAAAMLGSDASNVPSLYTPDAAIRSPMFGAVVGIDEIVESYRKTGEIYANIHTTLETRIVEENRAAEVNTVRATHVGEFAGIPASHRQITFTAVSVYEFRDGRIADERRVYDFTSVLMQLGVLRAKPA